MKGILLIVGILIVVGIIGYFAQMGQSTKQAETKMKQAKTNTIQDIQITPISHATMVLQMSNQVIYIDPAAGDEALKKQPIPTLILITDIHPDHLNPELLKAVSKENTVIVVPQAVKEELPEDIPGTVVVLANGEKTTQKGIEIEAIPMYNIPQSEDAKHTKGRGNGYVLSADNKRLYIAGDTSVTPEMKAL